MRRIAGAVLWIASALFALTAPLYLDRGTLNDLWNLAFFIILASAWNLLGGFAGQVSLGYSAFLGIGAYTTVLLAMKGVNPFVTLPLGAAIAAIFSVIIGLPAFRLRGPYFTIATIGVAEAIRVCASSVSFTGGSSGIRMPADTFNFNLNYYSMVILGIITIAVAIAVKRSAFGTALAAIKQDIDAAEALGVNSTRFKLLAHAISAALVALAGSLFAVNFQYIAPGSVFDFRLSLNIVLMPIIGGVGTVAGPALGALIFSTLQIKLLSIPALRDSFLFIYGGLLIVVMLFEPAGLVGLVKRFGAPPSWQPVRRLPAGAGRMPADRPAGSRRSEVVLSVKRLSKRFGGLLAVAFVDFDVREGEIFGIIGPNGAGKTTLFSCLVGALAPTTGEILFDGRRIDGLPNHAVVRRGIVRTHQIVRPFRAMTVAENVAVAAHFGAGKRSGADAERRVHDILEQTALASEANALAGTLTIGQLKRLEIARALATEPRVICLDEVMGGLNPAEIVGAMALIRSIRDSGVTVLMIEHHVHAVVGVSDRILVLNFGEKIAEGAPQEVLREPEVVTAYLGDVDGLRARPT